MSLPTCKGCGLSLTRDEVEDYGNHCVECVKSPRHGTYGTGMAVQQGVAALVRRNEELEAALAEARLHKYLCIGCPLNTIETLRHGTWKEG